MTASTARSLLAGDVPSRVIVPSLQAEDLAAAAEGLARFERDVLANEQARWQLALPRDPRFAEPDDGVMRRTSAGGDQKIFLHFRPDLPVQLAERGVQLCRWQTDWLYTCFKIWAACDVAMTALVGEMDRLRPDLALPSRLRNLPDEHCLRILKYNRRAGTIAHTHTDRCAITFRIAESHPGFYIEDGGTRRLYEAPPTPMVDCFVGDQLAELTERAAPATLHGAEDQTAGAEERWAIVFFGKIRSY